MESEVLKMEPSSHSNKSGLRLPYGEEAEAMLLLRIDASESRFQHIDGCLSRRTGGPSKIDNVFSTEW